MSEKKKYYIGVSILNCYEVDAKNEEEAEDKRMSEENKETKYFSASCNLNFTAGSYEEACDQLLDYLKDSVNDGDVTSWFINEE